MGFSCQSSGSPINPGEKLSFPIAAEDRSVLDLQWSSLDDADVEFSLSFVSTSGDGGDVLVAPAQLHEGQAEYVINGPGTCLLTWNNRYFGWLGGSVCTVAYSASLQSAESDEQRQQREEEEAQLKAAALRELRREQAQLRREHRQTAMMKLEAQKEESQICLAETRTSIKRHDEDITKLQQTLAAAEEARSAELAMASALEQEISAALEALQELSAEEDEVDNEAMRELDEDPTSPCHMPEMPSRWVKSNPDAKKKAFDEPRKPAEREALTRTVYLPTQLGGVTVLFQEDSAGSRWKATNAEFKSDAPGLGYRLSKDLEDRAGDGSRETDFVRWDVTLDNGEDSKMGWVKFTQDVTG